MCNTGTCILCLKHLEFILLFVKWNTNIFKNYPTCIIIEIVLIIVSKDSFPTNLLFHKNKMAKCKCWDYHTRFRCTLCNCVL